MPNAKPGKLKALEGNRSRRKIPKEPPAAGSPEMPAGLCEVAAEHWRFVTDEVASWGIIKRIDSHKLEMLCRTWALWKQAEAVAREDPIDQKTRTAVIAYGQQWARLASEFGMDPIARARMAIQEQKADDLAEFLKVTG